MDHVQGRCPIGDSPLIGRRGYTLTMSGDLGIPECGVHLGPGKTGTWMYLGPGYAPVFPASTQVTGS